MLAWESYRHDLALVIADAFLPLGVRLSVRIDGLGNWYPLSTHSCVKTHLVRPLSHNVAPGGNEVDYDVHTGHYEGQNSVEISVGACYEFNRQELAEICDFKAVENASCKQTLELKSRLLASSVRRISKYH